MPDAHSSAHASAARPSRRPFLISATGVVMTGGLAAAYGTLGAMLGRFVYPARHADRAWLFVCTVESLAPGGALQFTTPTGVKIVVARQGAGGAADDFLALSSVCPHLGCRVHWEAQNDRFFCPCHNGAFDKTGQAIAGPPRDAHQALMRFPLKVEKGLLYLEAPLTTVVACHSACDARSQGAV